MGIKIKVKTKHSKVLEEEQPPKPVILQWELSAGQTVQVGDDLLVKHYSSDSWQSAVLKGITERDGIPTFSFYLPSPGWVSVHEERVKVPKPPKKIKVKKTKQQEGD